MSDFIYYNTDKHFSEHHNYPVGENVSIYFHEEPQPICFQNNADKKCVDFKKINDSTFLHTSYFVGVDWIDKFKKAIYVEPKLNNNNTQTNYLKMLFSALKHPELVDYTTKLFEIKFDKPYIEIHRKQDLITPLLVVQFLRIVKEIVRKGLKKSYYKVDQNLYGRVKGKILVSQTIKQNILKNKPLNTMCRFDEFGWNGLENRLLKKALLFVRNYLPSNKTFNSEQYIAETFSYIMPAFECVSDDVNLNEIKHTKTNIFYKEYKEGIHLAKIILQRFGYNIHNTEDKEKIKIPPFWIDMSKLFELYVYGQLKEKTGNKILYGKQATGNFGVIPDYLQINNPEQKIIDAKYKQQYQKEKIYFDEYLIKDIRQLAGYSRDTEILSKLGITEKSQQLSYIPECLIIYPDQSAKENLFENKITEIIGFSNFFKQPIKLPTIK